ncbi:hypothetical protein SEA_OUTIS_72 [Gordonia phage Outis]|nr:hypothetical protein SEA_STARSTRUCK_72 [Gordonia phage StarStruck]WKW85045.1 hypothetical protein SEA_OUTIS_72 [Gordonia phage Outis]
MKMHTVTAEVVFRVEGHAAIVGERAISIVPERVRVARSWRFIGRDGRGMNEEAYTSWSIRGARVLKSGIVSHKSEHWRFGSPDDLDQLRQEGHSDLANRIRGAIALLPTAGGIE